MPCSGYNNHPLHPVASSQLVSLSRTQIQTSATSAITTARTNWCLKGATWPNTSFRRLKSCDWDWFKCLQRNHRTRVFVLQVIKANYMIEINWKLYPTVIIQMQLQQFSSNQKDALSGCSLQRAAFHRALQFPVDPTVLLQKQLTLWFRLDSQKRLKLKSNEPKK